MSLVGRFYVASGSKNVLNTHLQCLRLLRTVLQSPLTTRTINMATPILVQAVLKDKKKLEIVVEKYASNRIYMFFARYFFFVAN